MPSHIEDRLGVEVIPVLSSGVSPEGFVQFLVERWRRRSDLPRHVFLHTPAEPKPFYCDLDSPLFVDLLRRLLGPAAGPATPPILHVTEMLPSPEEMWLRDERGRYASELLLHLCGP